MAKRGGRLSRLVSSDFDFLTIYIYKYTDHRSCIVNKLSDVSPPDLMGFLHSSLGVLTSSQHYITPALAQTIYNSQPSYEYGSSTTALPMTESLLAIYASLKDSTDIGPSTTRARAQKAVLKLLECGLAVADLDTLPLSVAAPVMEAVRTAQNNPPSGWDRDAYELVGRGDLARMAELDGEEGGDGFEGAEWLGDTGGSSRIDAVSLHADLAPTDLSLKLCFP